MHDDEFLVINICHPGANKTIEIVGCVFDKGKLLQKNNAHNY